MVRQVPRRRAPAVTKRAEVMAARVKRVVGARSCGDIGFSVGSASCLPIGENGN